MPLLKRMRKTISLVVMLAMSISLMSNVWAAEVPAVDDLKGHWAETNMRNWIKEGLLQGYDDGSYQPDKAITRAELIALTNRSFALTEKADIAFKDLSSTNWAYEQVAAAVKAEYVKGYEDGTIRPNQQVSREEASFMIASLLKLALGEANGIEQFKDAAAIAAWSKPAVAALVKETIISGYTNGNFGPKDKLTRAQAVTLLVNALAAAKPAAAYDKPGVYGPESGTETIKGNVIVSSPGVTLRNTVIEGNLTIAAGVGEGDAFFKKVTVKGKTTVQGGGANSVHFEDSVLVRISVNKKDGTVRVVVAGSTTVQHVLIESPVKLEESFLTDSGFGNVELSDALPSGSQVQLTGVFENVNVLSSNIKVSIPSGSVQQLTVGSNASNAEVNLGKDASVQQLILDAVAKLIGQGKVEKATVNHGASGSTFETKPAQVGGDAAGSITTPPSSGGVIGGGTGGGSTGGGNNGGSDGGNNGGGSDGGNNGGGTNVCIQENAPLECKESNLVNLVIDGHTLTQLNSNGYELEPGFKPDVYAYSIINTLDTPSVRVPVTVTKSVYEIVGFYVLDGKGKGNYVEDSKSTDETSTFYVDIQPQEDLAINLYVTSGDKVRTKTYTITIHYPRTIQEASKLNRFNSYTVDKDNNTIPYYTYFYSIKMVQGKKLLPADTIELYHPGEVIPFETCTVSNLCILQNHHISQQTGTIDVKIIREQQLLASGSYQYDKTPVTNITENVGVRVAPFTKQGLIDAFNEDSWFTTPFSHAYKAYLDPAIIKQVHPEAKYFSYSVEIISKPTTVYPGAPVKDMIKTNTAPRDFSNEELGIRLNEIQFNNEEYSILGSYYHRSDSPTDPKQVHDMFFFVYFYDANLNIIGYHVTPIVFDEEHVAEGYTPLHTWNPVID